jgi:hypothetical protein
MHTDGLEKLYTSPNIIRIIKSRSKRWAGYEERMEAERNVYRILAVKLKRKNH